MKWIKMQRILCEMTNRNTEIRLLTELPNSLRSMIEFNNTCAVISLNAKYAKGWNDIVDSIAHEITHVYYGDNKHKEYHKGWDTMVEQNRQSFLERMGDDGHSGQQ